MNSSTSEIGYDCTVCGNRITQYIREKHPRQRKLIYCPNCKDTTYHEAYREDNDVYKKSVSSHPRPPSPI